jgi:hypothetical protein
MTIGIDESALRRKFAHYLDDARVRKGLREMVADPFLLAFFLMSVSEGEAMGEAGVTAILGEEVATLVQDLEKQRREEAGHKEISLELARELFPEYFEDGVYRYASKLTGREYYLAVLRRNRQSLADRGADSRLNLYLTTTLGYEIMVALYYQAVIEAVEASPLPPAVRDRVATRLRRILAEEETHLGVADQHDRLLATDRSRVGAGAAAQLDRLAALTADDYERAVELSMRQIVEMAGRYAAGPRYREEIASGLPEGCA